MIPCYSEFRAYALIRQYLIIIFNHSVFNEICIYSTFTDLLLELTNQSALRTPLTSVVF